MCQVNPVAWDYATDSVYVSIVNATITASDSIVCAGDSVSLTIGKGASSLFNSASSSNLPSYLPTNGLVAWYPFNGNANDESGNGFGLNQNGNPTISNSVSTNAGVCFDGFDDHLYTSQPWLQNPTEVTVSCWVRVDRTQGYPDNDQVFLSQANSGQWGLGFRENTQKVSFQCKTSTWHVSEYDLSAVSGWTHLGGVLNLNSGVIKLYINGSLVDSNGVSGNSLYNYSGWAGIIGGVGNAGGKHFEGCVDDIAIYNRTLSSSEIQSLYSANTSNLSYNWSTGDTTASITANPLQTTTYYCTVSDGITSCIDSLTVYVNNTLSLDLGADTLSVCGQDSAVIDAGAGYSSYLWSNGDSTQSITTYSSGMYSCTVGGGSCTAIDSVYINIGILDDPNDVTVDLSVADTASFNVNYLDSSTSYQWQLKTSFGWLNLLDSSSFYVGGKSHLLGLKNIGTNFNGFEFRCTVTSASCSEVSDSAVLSVIGTGAMVSNPTSLNEAVSQFTGKSNSTPIELPVSIRPNPTTGIFYVHPFIEGTYSLIDSKGRTVESGRATPSYDLSSVPNGLYILRLTLETSTHQIRVIKQ